jgi:hypothetical protein
MYSAPLDPAMFSKSVMIEASDIPPHMTLAQWRDAKRMSSMRSRRRRLRLRVWRKLQAA